MATVRARQRAHVCPARPMPQTGQMIGIEPSPPPSHGSTSPHPPHNPSPRKRLPCSIEFRATLWGRVTVGALPSPGSRACPNDHPISDPGERARERGLGGAATVDNAPQPQVGLAERGEHARRALGGVFIQANHVVAHARATKAWNDTMVLSQRRAIRRKRSMRLMKHSMSGRSR